jgi:hypothetical protein
MALYALNTKYTYNVCVHRAYISNDKSQITNKKQNSNSKKNCMPVDIREYVI